MACAQQNGMSARLISLANPEDWETAVSRVPHGPAHTHWYNAALAASIFHYNEYGVRVTKQYLAERGVAIRLVD